ncbi:MAG: sulfurtransferase [Rhodobacteraceae bacterium]|nr:sulfurtransferase [Paracoccaceae bacterium]
MNLPLQETVREIAPNDAVSKIAAKQAVLIDVRDIAELNSTGKAKDALHIPLMMISTKTDPKHPEFHADLSTETAVILYCASGGRSGMAAQMLLSYGFTEVYNLGGLMHWQQGGGEVVRG